MEIARHKVVSAAKRVRLALKQTFAAEGKHLRRRAGGYAHAKQFKRLKKVLRRQRTILGIVIRETQRKLAALLQPSATHIQARSTEAPDVLSLTWLNSWLERAQRIHAQTPNSKYKLYALHAPEVECVRKAKAGNGKARKPYEFGVKVGLAATRKSALMVGALSFPGNPYDGLAVQGFCACSAPSCSAALDFNHRRRPRSSSVSIVNQEQAGLLAALT